MARRPAHPRLVAGDIAGIRFLDHVAGGDDVAEFWVYGRVAVVSRDKYTIDSWALADPKADREHQRENIESFTIIRSTIREVLRLVPESSSRGT